MLAVRLVGPPDDSLDSLPVLVLIELGIVELVTVWDELLLE